MRSKHYSPAINRFLVKVLFHQSKAQKIPMTVLTNQILESGLRGREGWRQAEQEMALQAEATSNPVG